jgi:hypothetical protein
MHWLGTLMGLRLFNWITSGAGDPYKILECHGIDSALGEGPPARVRGLEVRAGPSDVPGLDMRESGPSPSLTRRSMVDRCRQGSLCLRERNHFSQSGSGPLQKGS